MGGCVQEQRRSKQSLSLPREMTIFTYRLAVFTFSICSRTAHLQTLKTVSVILCCIVEVLKGQEAGIQRQGSNGAWC